MKSKLYFRHDVYTLDDGAIMTLVYQHHEAGYGVFWAVVERLTAEQSHRLPLEALVVQVSVKLIASKPSKVREIIQTCIDLGLLVEQDGMVYNERVLRQCEQMEQYSKTQTENVQKRWEKYRGNTTVEPSKKETEAERKERARMLVERYHQLCPSLPKVKVMTDMRVSHAGTFLHQFSEDVIAEGFNKAEASEFLKHGRDTWKGANFDWIINKNNFAKILEGQYDNERRSTICNDSEQLSSGRNNEGGFDL